MPGPLAGVRIADLTWLLAGAGGPKMLAAMGAEVIRCEWVGKLDFLRLGPPQVPLPDQEDTGGFTIGAQDPSQAASLNRNGNFNDINAGKYGCSLNLAHPRGKELFKQLVAVSDVVMENYSASAMDRMGLGYEVLKAINPDIIYIQASGWGKTGPYRDWLSYGPTAQAMSGLTAMSGLPDREPAGWGFSYLDHNGGYFVALATMMALLHRKRTGGGLYLDLSQVATGFLWGGTAVLDYSANGRRGVRVGNRSPNRPASPHGAFPARGVDQWVAIAVFTDEQWAALVETMGTPDWARDGRYTMMAGRLEHQDELEARLSEWTRDRDRFEIMHLLQRRAVPAGVCQTPADRVDTDPQLAATDYLVELDHSEIGRWPVQNLPFTMSETPSIVGQPSNRGAPCYGEDNDYVYQQLLGLTPDEQAALKEAGVI